MELPVDEVGIAVQAAWFALLARAGHPTLRSADGSFAVRTGLASNTDNGAVLTPATTDADLDALLAHASRDGAPASAVLTAPADVARLVARGWRPETAAHEMVGPLVVPVAPGDARVVEVTDDAGLAVHVGVFRANGWHETDDEAAAALAVERHLGCGGSGPVRRWLALVDGTPVGAASSFRVPGTDVVALTDLVVDPGHRRRGLGTALTAARLRAARTDGATTVHVSPSPDGAALHAALGLTARPTPPDRWFYGPTG